MAPINSLSALRAELDAISKRLDAIEDDLRCWGPVMATLPRIIQSIEEVIRAVKGFNGTEGLITKVSQLETHKHEEVTIELRKVLYGDSTTEGLAHQVEELKKWRDSLSKWGWFLATTMVVSSINLLLTVYFRR